MKVRGNAVLVALAGSLIWIGTVAAQTNADAAQPVVQTVEGVVRDIACPVQKKKSTAKDFNLECAKQCAKQGSPLAILTDDGTMYMPISNSMPDASQRARLLPFVGKYVHGRGTVYE